MVAWDERPPPGPVSATLMTVAVVVGLGMVALGWRVIAGDAVRSPMYGEVGTRIGRVFLVPGIVVTLASLAGLVLRRRRGALTRRLMIVAAVGLLVAGVVVIVGVVGIPMILVGAGLLVSAFSDEEPGPSIQRLT